MRTSNRSVFLRLSTSDGVTSRTAVYGPVCTVVWQGSAGDRRPYANQRLLAGRFPEPIQLSRLAAVARLAARGRTPLPGRDLPVGGNREFNGKAGLKAA
jgi:hypothetical protein